MFTLDKSSKQSLRDQVKQRLIETILSGAFDPGKKLPSSRLLAKQLSIARNTVAAAYDDLVDSGVLIARPRSGMFVNTDAFGAKIGPSLFGVVDTAKSQMFWEARLKDKPAEANSYRPGPGWRRYPYNFVDGHFDPSFLVPGDWRGVARTAHSIEDIRRWSHDLGDADDPDLIEQIRTKILTRQGVLVTPDQVLVLAGPQQGLSLVAETLLSRSSRVAIEVPGNPHLLPIMRLRTENIVSMPAAKNDIISGNRLADIDLVCLTRRMRQFQEHSHADNIFEKLLKVADNRDFLILEDDTQGLFENRDRAPPPIFALDGGRRTVFVGGFGPYLTSVFGLTFLVGAPNLVRRIRRLRQITAGAPPLNTQRLLAHFLSSGNFDVTALRHEREVRKRMRLLREAVNHYFRQNVSLSPVGNGSAIWIDGPPKLDTRRLVAAAHAQGILIDHVDPYYATRSPPSKRFRLAVSGVEANKIRKGISKLSDIVQSLCAPDPRDDRLASARWLTGSSLRAAIADTTLLYRTVYGEPCTIQICADGRLLGRAGYANEDADEGLWQIDGEFWVRQWQRWAYAEEARFRVKIIDQRIFWFDPMGQLADSAVIEKNR